MTLYITSMLYPLVMLYHNQAIAVAVPIGIGVVYQLAAFIYLYHGMSQNFYIWTFFMCISGISSYFSFQVIGWEALFSHLCFFGYGPYIKDNIAPKFPSSYPILRKYRMYFFQGVESMMTAITVYSSMGAAFGNYNLLLSGVIVNIMMFITLTLYGGEKKTIDYMSIKEEELNTHLFKHHILFICHLFSLPFITFTSPYQYLMYTVFLYAYCNGSLTHTTSTHSSEWVANIIQIIGYTVFTNYRLGFFAIPITLGYFNICILTENKMNIRVTDEFNYFIPGSIGNIDPYLWIVALVVAYFNFIWYTPNTNYYICIVYVAYYGIRKVLWL
jgi:hypothetical protein